jgi:hypothetical protein
MKTNLNAASALLALAGCALTALPAHASLIAEDSFNYSLGELVGQSGGTGWSAGWTGATAQSDVVEPSTPLGNGGNRAAALGGNNNNALSRSLSGAVNADSVFVSFLFRPTAAFSNNDFISLWLDNSASGDHTGAPNLGLKADQGGTGTSDFMSRLSLGYEAYFGTSTPNSTYQIVGQLMKSVSGTGNRYDRFRLWINPTIGDANTWDAQASIVSGGITSFDRVGFRTANLSGVEIAHIDELRLGTSFDDVVPSAVPEPSAMSLFGLGAALIGGVRFYRRKA